MTETAAVTPAAATSGATSAEASTDRVPRLGALVVAAVAWGLAVIGTCAAATGWGGWPVVAGTVVILVAGVLAWFLRDRAALFVVLWLLDLALQAWSAEATWRHGAAAPTQAGWAGAVGMVLGGLTPLLVLAGYLLGRRQRLALALGVAATAVVLRTAVLVRTYQLEGLVGASGVGGGRITWPRVVAMALNGVGLDILLPVLLGALVQRELVAARRARAQLVAEREQRAQELAAALRGDRQRMAHELHDLAAHHSTAVVINARAARKLGARDPDLVPRLMDDIVDESQAAQTSLRQMVHLLSDPDEAPLAPQPSLAEIAGLVERTRQLNPDVVLEQDDAQVSPEVALAAYRIVQEALTNALRYAPGAPLTISVGPVDDVLMVQVVNGRGTGLAEPGLGTGHGIEGMRLRAEVLGGSLEAGPHGRGWRVVAELPRHPEQQRTDEGTT